MTVCLPCEEQEHDCCHNLLWQADCPCPHDHWPEPHCGVHGRGGWSTTRLYVCELPRDGHQSHEGRYWFLPNPPAQNSKPWWGWVDKPYRWGWRRTIAPPPRPTGPFPGDAPDPLDQLGLIE